LEVFLGKSEDPTPGHISTMAPSPSGNSPLPELSGDSWKEKKYGKASSSVPNQGAQGDEATSYTTGGVELEQAGPSHQKSGLSHPKGGFPQLEDLQRPVLLGDISLDRRNQSWLSLRLVSPKRQSQLLGGELSVNLYRRMIPHIG